LAVIFNPPLPRNDRAVIAGGEFALKHFRGADTTNAQWRADGLFLRATMKGGTFLVTIIKNDDGTVHTMQFAEQKATDAANERGDAECMRSLECWGSRHRAAASVYCTDAVERLAKNNFEWTDGILEPKFSQFQWKNAKSGVVTYVGDNIRFQNGFGAWAPHVYECDFEPKSSRVLDVRASPGQLPPP
jgi:hypothetical protein